MIEFKRDDNMSIYLSFDEQGLVLLCNAIEVGMLVILMCRSIGR
jgi:hypothetical protein